jgi:hypothetical protein
MCNERRADPSNESFPIVPVIAARSGMVVLIRKRPVEGRANRLKIIEPQIPCRTPETSSFA